MTTPVIPNFLIAGAAKCGTTTLAALLARHPEVFLPARKEPGFFLGRDADGCVGDRHAYLSLFADGAGSRRVGEASTGYLYEPSAPAAIRRFLGPEVRILLLLRNPMAMAFSLWQHQTRMGLESLGFPDAIAAEPGRRGDPAFLREAQGWPANYFYVDRADYAPQVRRFLDTFGHEGVRVFLFEEFFRDGLPLWGELCAFLDVTPGAPPANERRNAGGAPRLALVNRVLASRGLAKQVAKAVIPDALRARVGYALSEWNAKPAERATMDPDLWDALTARLRPGVAELSVLLGRDLEGLWLAPAGPRE